MRIKHHEAHLTYCSNIHPGESWSEVYSNLRQYVTKVRDAFDTKPFGVGLRLSNQASLELLQEHQLEEFKEWLTQENLYVFTVNGFPYGAFHDEVVKDQVHTPDWTTTDRLDYTKRLFTILAALLPEGQHGGVSTSPISYRYWHEDLESVKEEACEHLVDLIIFLHDFKVKKGKLLHLDMEPEPDGVLETSREFVDFFRQFICLYGVPKICRVIGCTLDEANEIVRNHFRICYDVCHFAVGFEKSKDAVQELLDEGIKIGRIQISAAMSTGFQKEEKERKQSVKELKKFDEPVYLHQAVAKAKDGELVRYGDLEPAVEEWGSFGAGELRTHFHVPVFTQDYGTLTSTQSDIKDVLALWKEQNFTDHLEVETYTWKVLPDDMQLDIVTSIVRELKWVIDTLGGR